MAKYEIEIEEQRTYRSTAIIESDLSQDEVDSLLDEMEERNIVSSDDLMDEILREKGFKLIGYTEDEDGELDELEITSLEKLKEDEE